MEWTNEAKELLEELMQPIPVFVRPMAKKKIEASIKEEATGDEIDNEAVIRGYIKASSGDMKERTLKLLKAKGIDTSSYEDLV